MAALLLLAAAPSVRPAPGAAPIRLADGAAEGAAATTPESAFEADLAGARRLRDTWQPAACVAESERLIGVAKERFGAGSHQAAEAMIVFVDCLPERDPRRADLSGTILAVMEKADGPDSAAFADALLNLSEDAARTDAARGEAMRRRALAIMERRIAGLDAAAGADGPALAEALVRQAKILGSLGEGRSARPLLERALAIQEKALGPRHPDLAETVGLLSYVAHDDFHDPAAALPLMERAVAIQEGNPKGEPNDRAEGYGFLGLLHQQTGDWPGALPLLEKAIAIDAAAYGADHPLTARMMNNLAVYSMAVGDYARARDLFERRNAIMERVFGPEGDSIPFGERNLANLLREMGEYALARPHFERALALIEKQAPEAAAEYVVALANLVQDTGDYAEARTLFRRAFALAGRTRGPESEEAAVALSGLGDLAAIDGEPDEARRTFEKMTAIDLQHYDSEDGAMAWDYDALGRAFLQSGDLAAARTNLERGLAIREAHAGPARLLVAESEINLATLELRAGDPARARALLDDSLAIRERVYGEAHPRVAACLALLAEARAAAGDAAGALEAALRAESIGREHLALTARLLPERQALRYAAVRESGLDIALRLAAAAGGPPAARAWDALIRSRGLVIDAMAERHGSPGSHGDPETAPLADALAAARRRLANLVVRGPGDVPPQDYRGLIEAAAREKERAERALAERSAAFRADRRRGRIGLDEVTAALPAGSALVAFARYAAGPPGGVSSAAYIAFVLSGAGRAPAIVPVGTAADIDGMIAAWADRAGWRGGAGLPDAAAERDYRNVAGRLAGAIWDPIVPHLGGAHRVFVVPEGAINLVSFATLPAPGGAYQVEKGPLFHYLSAERDLAEPRASRRGRELLAVGGPAFDDDSSFAFVAERVRPAGAPAKAPSAAPAAGAAFRGARAACGDFRSMRFEPLPAAALEIGEIARIWKRGGGSVTTLRGAGAAEAAFKAAAAGKRIVHLATHGFVAGDGCPSALHRGAGASWPVWADQEPPAAIGDNPLLLSGLALCGANRRDEAGLDEDDGILTAEEIASLDLRETEWVVLSACDSGSGEVQAGEGVLGLRRAVQVAGAGTLIMSLWSVEDESARRWMRELYEARVTARLPTAEAVRRADLRLLQRRRSLGLPAHPFYWGAFIAAGDWR